MGPGHLYYLSILLVALFLARSNRLARLIVALWLAGEIAYLLGAPLSVINLAQHALGLLIGIRLIRDEWSIPPVLMFIPLLGNDLLSLFPGYEETAWWGLFYTAQLQLLLLPFGTDLAKERAHWQRLRAKLAKFVRQWRFWPHMIA